MTTATTDIVPITTPLVMKQKKDNEQRSSTNSKNHSKSRDDSDMETFLEYQKEVSSLKKTSIKESKRHNKEIEKIEQRKANAAKMGVKK